MTSMPTPSWAEEMKDQMAEAYQNVEAAKFKPIDLSKITSFSTFFAEWMLKDKDLLVHLFPRDGAGDRWDDGKYINRCRNCRAEVEYPKRLNEMKPCHRCGHTGLVYVPGRVEERSTKAEFPADMADYIKSAADKVWMGDVAIDYAPELGAFAVQFQHAKNTLNTVGESEFLDKFLEELDKIIEG